MASRNNNQIMQELKRAVVLYQSVAGKNVMFIFSGKRTAEPFYGIYETCFKPENFIHLTGYETKKKLFRNRHPYEPLPAYLNGTPSAEDFYFSLLEGSLNLSDYTFESKNHINEKLDVLPGLLNYRNVKLYQEGTHDLDTLKNHFEACVGNTIGIIGFERRDLSESLPTPVTALKNSISAYCTKDNIFKIVAVMTRYSTDPYYNCVTGAPKSGILCEDLPEYIQAKIHPDIHILLQ